MDWNGQLSLSGLKKFLIGAKAVTIYQIEMNKVDYKTGHYMYLRADETITDNPATALEFDSFEESEKYRLEHDYGNIFHTQKMLRN